MKLKNFLKALKLQESTISMILGAIIIIIVGILLVNYFKKEEVGETLEQGITSEETKPAEKGRSHIVKKGETLWSIAEDAYGSGYNWVDIAQENNLANPGLIEEGQKLVIPDVESRLATIIDKTSHEEQISGSSYTVVKGDCLWTIAVRAYGDGYKWVEIANKNNLKNPNLIHPGNFLILPR